MGMEFREQKIEFVIGVDNIFYRITFQRKGAASPWVLEMFDILMNKIVYMSKIDASVYPDPEFAADIVRTFTNQRESE